VSQDIAEDTGELRFKSGTQQSPSNEEPWHFLLAPLWIILVAVPL